MRRIIPLVFVAIGLIPVGAFKGGIVVEPSEKSAVPAVAETASIGPVSQKQNDEVLGTQIPGASLKACIREPGARRFVIIHEDAPLNITAFHNGRFHVSVVREFTADDMDELADHHPELLQPVSSFPRKIKGNGVVRMKIETALEWEFLNERQFEEEQPELCEIYRAFREAPIDIDESTVEVSVTQTFDP